MYSTVCGCGGMLLMMMGGSGIEIDLMFLPISLMNYGDAVSEVHSPGALDFDLDKKCRKLIFSG